MKKKILVIDDNETFMNTIKDGMPSEKYEVIGAEDGAKGFDMVKSENPDLILLDLLMPNVNGVQFLKKLRAEMPDVKTPIVITSNVSGMDMISEGVALGVKGYIVKSEESLQTIIDTVERVLGETGTEGSETGN